MVLRLAEALQVPLRERNALLLAAEYAPLYRDTALDTPELASACQAIALLIAQLEPYPVLVLDRWGWILPSDSLAGAIEAAGAGAGLAYGFEALAQRAAGSMEADERVSVTDARPVRVLVDRFFFEIDGA